MTSNRDFRAINHKLLIKIHLFSDKLFDWCKTILLLIGSTQPVLANIHDHYRKQPFIKEYEGLFPLRLQPAPKIAIYLQHYQPLTALSGALRQLNLSRNRFYGPNFLTLAPISRL